MNNPSVDDIRLMFSDPGQNVSVIYSGRGNPRKRLQHLLGTVGLLWVIYFFSFQLQEEQKPQSNTYGLRKRGGVA